MIFFNETSMMSNYREPISFQQYLLGKPLVFFFFQKWIHEFHSISQKMESNGGKVVDQKKIKENMIGKKGTKLIGGGFLLFRGGVQPFF